MSRKIVKLLFVAILVGTALQGILVAQDAKFRVPLNGSFSIVCAFNSTNCASAGNYHTGVDYHAANKDILASNAGKIVVIQNNGSNDHGLGNAVIVEHKIVNLQGGVEILYSLYAHMQSFIPGLYVGEAVVKGQKMGTMGSSGYGQANYWGSTPHLHLEIKRSAVLHNPSGTGQYWGYTPGNAGNYGYIDPTWMINSSTTAIGNDYTFWEFSGANNFEGWALFNIEAASVNSGALFDDPQAVDPYIVSPDIFIDASVLKYLKFRMASKALDGSGTIYFKTSSENGYAEDKKVSFTASNNGQFVDYSIYLGSHPKWTGKITGIRIDPTNAGQNGTNSDTIGWEWIRLSPTP